VSYFQAIVIAVVQGVTELFPVSSLGHSVLVPAWIGGSWQTLVTQSSQSSSETSFYLAYIVALHVATALALLVFFREDWIRIIRGFFRTLGDVVGTRRLPEDDADARLAWLIIIATIPVGITGLALEHVFRTIFAKPVAASIFLFVNGFILLAGERFRRRASVEADEEIYAYAEAHGGARTQEDIELAAASDVRLSHVSVGDSLRIGLLQVAALLPGISRSGITMVGGLWRGLSHEDAARFAFLLATPVILAAGVLKLPTLFGKAGEHIHGQAAVGFVICGVVAYISVRYLVRYFETKRLTPFAIYSLVVGLISFVHFV
jgi:undecaprenyl-diphosphatase